METIRLSYGEDKVHNFVALIILIQIALTIIFIKLVEHYPIIIGLLVILLLFSIFFTIKKALNVYCDLKFSNSVEFKLLKTTWFYKHEYVIFEKNEIKEFHSNKFKGNFFYILKTEKGTIRLQDPNNNANTKLIQGFEKLGIKVIS